MIPLLPEECGLVWLAHLQKEVKKLEGRLIRRNVECLTDCALAFLV